MPHQFVFSGRGDSSRQLAKAWLFLGIFALLASGVFSLLLVLSRAPFIQSLIPFTNFFHTALVVHVDLSVLIWFTAFACSLWVLYLDRVSRLDWLAYYLAVLGLWLIIIIPFVMDGQPILNNYIPILQTPLFYLGLGLYSMGLLGQVMRTILSPAKDLRLALKNPAQFSFENICQWGSYLAAVSALIAFAAFVYTWSQLSVNMHGLAYFEVLFWGSGHILQYTHLLIMLVVWLILLQLAYRNIPIRPYVIAVLLLLVFMPVLFSPLAYFQFELLSTGLSQRFTDLMKYGGLTSIPLGALITYYLWQFRKLACRHRHLLYALVTSLFLFAIGGLLGFMIRGANVVIPAHYHGSIVGITLAFMGLSYYLLQHFGYALPQKALKIARIQPLLYATGQLMHILGLAWSGGYGVQRKTAGTAQGLDKLPEIAGMALMGLGGLIAIIGGFLFLLVCFYSGAKAHSN